MNIVVLGKTDCGRCRAALDKLARLGLPHTYIPLDAPGRAQRFEPDGAGDVRAVPADWREVGRDALTTATLQEGCNVNHPPVFVIDGRAYDYPGAMAFLRSKPGRRSE